MRRFLGMGQPMTAVFCYNDIMASGVARALHEAKLSIPGDVSLVGFDDIELCQNLYPALTSVIQPGMEMGYQAAKILFQMLTDESEVTQRRIVHQPSLVVRESTGPCSN